MRTAGIREARQHLSAILEEVRKGREVLITDRGRPVARVVPPLEQAARPFSSHRRLRARSRLKGRPLSEDLADEREDRLEPALATLAGARTLLTFDRRMALAARGLGTFDLPE